MMRLNLIKILVGGMLIMLQNILDHSALIVQFLLKINLQSSVAVVASRIGDVQAENVRERGHVRERVGELRNAVLEELAEDKSQT